jgi:hypothetical protein
MHAQCRCMVQPCLFDEDHQIAIRELCGNFLRSCGLERLIIVCGGCFVFAGLSELILDTGMF